MKNANQFKAVVFDKAVNLIFRTAANSASASFGYPIKKIIATTKSHEKEVCITLFVVGSVLTGHHAVENHIDNFHFLYLHLCASLVHVFIISLFGYIVNRFFQICCKKLTLYNPARVWYNKGTKCGDMGWMSLHQSFILSHLKSHALGASPTESRDFFI